MSTRTTWSGRIYFSYNQFMVYDQSISLPGCGWTEEHTAQGFARRESVVNLRTLIAHGEAAVTVNVTGYKPRPEYERVIAVPFLVSSGKVFVDGPEDNEAEPTFTLPPGDYRLVAAQYVIGDAEEVIDLYFEPLSRPLERSVILVEDEELDPPTPLVETATIAGEYGTQ